MAANNPSLRAEALITDYLEQLAAGKQVNFDDLRLANPDIADLLHQALQARLGKTVNSDPAATMATQFSVDPVSGDPVAADPVAEDPVLIKATRLQVPITAAGTTGDELFAGKYELLDKLGEGGFGTVYLVRTKLDMRFALKVLNANMATDAMVRKRFVREMQIASSIQHPNSVPVRDADDCNGQLYYTMDFVEGKTVQDIIESQEHGRVEVARAVDWCCQALDFLEFLHDRDIVHRDLKPANMMVEQRSGSETVRILDLGIAKALGASEANTLLTMGGAIGTPLYMAPENIRGLDCDHRIDLYAIAVVLYECCSGRRLFKSGSVHELFDLITKREPDALPKVVPGFPVALWKIIERGLAKDPDARWSDAASFRAALQAYSSPVRTAAGVPAAKSSSKAALWVGLGTMVVLGGATFVGWPYLFPEETNLSVIDPTPESLPGKSLDNKQANVAGPAKPAPIVPVKDQPAPVLLAAPVLTLLAPKAEADTRLRVNGDSIEVTLGIVGSGTFSYSIAKGAPKTDVKLSLADNGVDSIAEIPLPGQDGPLNLDLFVTGPGGKAEQSLALVVDNTGPKLNAFRPEQRIAGLKVVIEIEADEMLGDGTLIANQKPLITGKVAKLNYVASGYGERQIEVKLVDDLGNPADSVQQSVTFIAPDVTAPKLTSAQSWFVLPGVETSVQVTADELLHPDTKIGAFPTEVQGKTATAKISIDADTNVTIVLVDEVENTSASIELSLKVAKIPAGMVAVKGTELDQILGRPKQLLHEPSGIVLCLVPPTPEAGFLMGAVKGDAAANTDDRERPQHAVRITAPFYMGRTEVTWGELAAAKQSGLDLDTPAPLDVSKDETDNRPAVQISWLQASDFCAWMGGELPTEAQWEWACRKNGVEDGKTIYPWGSKFGAYKDWANVVSDMSTSAPVASLGAGTLGLHDLIGNVMEWCRDGYQQDAYKNRGDSPVEDPAVLVPAKDSGRDTDYVVRGGDFNSEASGARISWRGVCYRYQALRKLGFRVCLELDE